MPLHAPDLDSTERILVFGPSGIGKSFSFYTIARLAAQTKADATFYVAASDRSVARMISDPDFRPHLLDAQGNRKNIVAADVHDWTSLITAVDKFQENMKPQDWLMIDLLTPAWQWAQDYFTNRIFGKSLDEYFLALRMEMQKNPSDKANKQKRGGFEGFKDWPVINSIWGTLRDKIVRSPGNIYATCGIKSLSAEQADKEQRAMFGNHGVLPEGQKHMAFDFQTVIWLSSTVPDVYEAITIKDRARPRMEGLQLGGKVGVDFAKKYLVDIAGWQMA